MSSAASAMASKTSCMTARALRRVERRGEIRSGAVRRLATSRGPAPVASVMDPEGIPWTGDAADDEPTGKRRRDVSALAPPGLNMTESIPGDSLVELAEKLNVAVVQSFKEGLYDECVVDMAGRGGPHTRHSLLVSHLQSNTPYHTGFASPQTEKKLCTRSL